MQHLMWSDWSQTHASLLMPVCAFHVSLSYCTCKVKCTFETGEQSTEQSVATIDLLRPALSRSPTSGPCPRQQLWSASFSSSCSVLYLLLRHLYTKCGQHSRAAQG